MDSPGLPRYPSATLRRARLPRLSPPACGPAFYLRCTLLSALAVLLSPHPTLTPRFVCAQAGESSLRVACARRYDPARHYD